MPKHLDTNTPLIISLVQIRRVLNRLSEDIEWESRLLDYIAELQAHLYEAFRGARRLILNEK